MTTKQARTPLPDHPGTLAVYYGADSVGIWPVGVQRNLVGNAIIGPLRRTTENVTYCRQFVASDAHLARIAELEKALREMIDHAGASHYLDGKGTPVPYLAKARAVLSKP